MRDYRVVRLLPGPQPCIRAVPKNATISSGPRRDSGSQRHGATNDCTLRESGNRFWMNRSAPETINKKLASRCPASHPGSRALIIRAPAPEHPLLARTEWLVYTPQVD